MAQGEYLKRGVDYEATDGIRTLPGKYYHNEGIYAEEVEKIFYKFWLYACRTEEIAEIGDYKVIEVIDESIIITRNKENQVKAHFNVCSHRGTQLCEKGKGSFKSKFIRCPYHAWTYSLDGELIGAPAMSESERFKKADCALPEAKVHIWEGFVFITLDKDPEPFEVQMEALIGKFKDWQIGELKIAKHIKYELNCNWKLILQNYQECYHCPGVHPMLTHLTPTQSAQHDYSKGAVIGGFMDLSKQGGSMTMTGRAAAPPICDVSGDDLQRVYYYSIFPNMLLTPHPDFVMFHHITPLGPNKIINDCYWLFRPEVIADPAAQEGINSAVKFWDITNKEDWQVCEQMQRGTKSKRFTRGYYSGREDILRQLDLELLKALGHSEPD